MKSSKNTKGFSLFELMLIILLVAVMVAVAVPRYKSMSHMNKETKTRNLLGALRSEITIYYAIQAVEKGQACWPGVDILSQIHFDYLPVNPYQAKNMAPDSIVIGYNKGEIVSKRGGWVYNPTTGEIWANTHQSDENIW